MRLCLQTSILGVFVRLALIPLIVFTSSAGASYMSPGVESELHTMSLLEDPQRSTDPYHQFNIGIAAYEASDYQSAAVIFTELAKSGYINAQYYLAIMLDSGAGVEEDHVQSAMWYMKAASKGHVEAQYNLGIAYAMGEGVAQDMKKSIYWMKKAALNGSINSQYNLGLIYILGDGVEINLEEGILWWKLAAKNGDSTAQYNLGMIYLEGRGVESDICEASRWWQISAENGYVQSMMALESLKQLHAGQGCLGMMSAR